MADPKKPAEKKPAADVNKSEEIRKLATAMKAKGEKPRPVTIIAALSSFDIIYTTTLGGPVRATLVPGISIYRIGFTQSEVGLASAFGIVLMALVLACVLPIQRLARASDR